LQSRSEQRCAGYGCRGQHDLQYVVRLRLELEAARRLGAQRIVLRQVVAQRVRVCVRVSFRRCQLIHEVVLPAGLPHDTPVRTQEARHRSWDGNESGLSD
jgi:hypothetical protein